MLSFYHDPHFTFRFADDRLVPRFHLQGVEARRRVSVFRLDPGTGERLGLLAAAAVGEGGWVDPRSRSSCGPGKPFIAIPKQVE
jgi:hypothetical protein